MMKGRGFTVIELLVVLAAIGLLLGVAAPRYIAHLDQARETVLKQNLRGIRDAIDKFYSDQGRYPGNLQELVTKRYLRALPEDPITQRTDSWTIIAPNGHSGSDVVFDVRSSAGGMALDGSTYASW
jgi:general secretion pathway protein G